MTDDTHRIVFAGYDEAADAYLRRFGASTVRRKWFDRLTDGLSTIEARVLDLGCGAGIPVARDLAAAGHVVVGVDGSRQQIAMARRNVPSATFIEADMCDVALDLASFDAVCAFYSMNHVAPARQGMLIGRIAAWLKPGGRMIASFGVGMAGEWTGDWLGTTMFFGHGAEAETIKLLRAAGLRIHAVSPEKQDNEDVEFMWVEASRER